jgi:hypothetical protein
MCILPFAFNDENSNESENKEGLAFTLMKQLEDNATPKTPRIAVPTCWIEYSLRAHCEDIKEEQKCENALLSIVYQH